MGRVTTSKFQQRVHVTEGETVGLLDKQIPYSKNQTLNYTVDSQFPNSMEIAKMENLPVNIELQDRIADPDTYVTSTVDFQVNSTTSLKQNYFALDLDFADMLSKAVATSGLVYRRSPYSIMGTAIISGALKQFKGKYTIKLLLSCAHDQPPDDPYDGLDIFVSVRTSGFSFEWVYDLLPSPFQSCEDQPPEVATKFAISDAEQPITEQWEEISLEDIRQDAL